MCGAGAEEGVRLRETADVLLGKVKRPGGYHRARPQVVAGANTHMAEKGIPLAQHNNDLGTGGLAC